MKMKNNNASEILSIILFSAMITIPLIGISRAIWIIVIIMLAIMLHRGASIIRKYYYIKRQTSNSNMSAINIDNLQYMNKIKNKFTIGIGVLLIIWLFFASIVIIDAGETGVYSLFGKVKDKELSSGLHLVIPFAKITKMNIKTQDYTMSKSLGEGKRVNADAITSLTKEGLSVDLDITVLYRLNEEKASDVYQTVGTRYDEVILRPAIRTVIRDVIAQYDAKDIYSAKREEAGNAIHERLKNDLESRGIIIEQVLLRNVELPADLAGSIQEKLQAEQEAQKYDFLLEKERKEKERKIIEAEGQRDAQKIINQSLSTNYLYYLYINQLKDLEGTVYVPTSPSTGMPLFRNIGQ